MLTSEKQKNYNLKYPKGGFSYYTLYRGIYDPENGIDERPVDAETGDRFEPQNSSDVYIATRKNGKTKWAIDENASRQTETGEGGSGGGGVTSWNDLTDKPFYEESVAGYSFSNPDYTSDACIEFNAEAVGVVCPCKALRMGNPVSSELLLGAVLVYYDSANDGEQTITVNSSNIYTAGEGYIIIANAFAVLVSPTDNATLSYSDLTFSLSIQLPTAGTYFVYADTSPLYGTDDAKYYAISLTKEPTTTVHKLDQKFLPDSGGAGGLVVNMTEDEQTEKFVGDKTFGEVADALSAARNVVSFVDVGIQKIVFSFLACDIGNNSIKLYYLLNGSQQESLGAENDYFTISF